MITKKFVRNSLIYTVAGSLPMASAIILLPFYTNYLSTSLYGALAIYTSFSLLVQILITYSFDTAVYIYFHDFKHDKQKLATYISSAFGFMLLVSAAVLLVSFPFGNFILKLIPSHSAMQFYPYGLISVGSGIFQGIIKVNSSLLQTQERAGTFFKINLFSFSFIALFTLLGLIFFPDNLIGPILGRLIGVGLVGGWVLFSVYTEFGFHFDFQLLKQTIGFNNPSLLYQLIQWFNNYYDRVLLLFFLPLSQIGIYDLAVKCLLSVEFVLTGFYNSFYPKVLGMLALQPEKKSTVEINRYYNGLTAVTVLLVTFGIFALPIAIQWFVNKPGYLASIPLLPLIAITYLFRVLRLYMAMPYAAVKFYKPLPIYYLIIVSIKIAGMFLLIPQFGLRGAVFATWIGYAAEIIILYFGIRSKFLFEFNALKLILIPVVIATIILLVEQTFGSQLPLLTHTAYIIFGMALLAWGYRNELKVFTWTKILK
ncbi:MAG: oligosaccharide flippase family protein [Bacteroidetes bacterium]|nr:oligosaccharide flippase family protein [Bacteroidota bacterium]